MCTYELTAKGKKVSVEDQKGQTALIYPLLKKATTATAIAEAVGKKLETKQQAVRVVRHYLSLWTRAGLVRVRGGK